MIRRRRIVLFVLSVAMATQTPAFAGEPGREFSAELEANFRIGGGNRMLVNLVVDRFTTAEEAQRLADVLEQGGQGALLSALKGRSDGRLRLGALDRPGFLDPGLYQLVDASGSALFGHRFGSHNRIRFDRDRRFLPGRNGHLDRPGHRRYRVGGRNLR